MTTKINRNVGIHVVGGFVRDLYLGRGPKDLDLLVDGDVEYLGHDIARTFGGVCTLGNIFEASAFSSLDHLCASSCRWLPK